MSSVLDASAMLAFLQGEDGADEVESALTAGSCCSSVNWSEVAQKVRAAGADWQVAASLLASYELRVESAMVEDAEAAARLWRKGSGLSLADRFCIALGERLDLAVLTADGQWGSSDKIQQIR